MPSTKRKIGIIGVGFGAQVYVRRSGRKAGTSRRSAAAIATRRRRPRTDAGIARRVHRSARADRAGRPRRGRDHDAARRASRPAPSRRCAAGKHVMCEKPFALDATQATEMRDAAERSGKTAMVGHEFRHTPQRAYIKQLLDDGYIGKFRMCTIELFLDRYVTREAAAADVDGLQGGRRRAARRARLALHRRLRHWFGDVATVNGRLDNLRPDLIDPATKQIVKSETDDTFQFTLDVRERRHGDDDRVVRRDARARREDRRDGRARHADRRAGRAQSDGGRRRRREPRRRAAEALATPRGTRRSTTTATRGCRRSACSCATFTAASSSGPRPRRTSPTACAARR